MQTHAPSIALYTREDLPRLSLLTEAAWAHLADGRTLSSAPARGVHWAGLELALTTATLQLGTVAYPPTYPALAAASTPAARLNVSAQTLAAVAFDLEFRVARAEGRATDEWLVQRAPRVLGKPSWQAFLDAALFRLGRPWSTRPRFPLWPRRCPTSSGPVWAIAFPPSCPCVSAIPSRLSPPRMAPSGCAATS